MHAVMHTEASPYYPPNPLRWIGPRSISNAMGPLFGLTLVVIILAGRDPLWPAPLLPGRSGAPDHKQTDRGQRSHRGGLGKSRHFDNIG